MICCTIFAALLGLFMRPFVLLRTNPLAWRFKHQPAVSDPPLRATGRLQSFSHAFAGLAFLVRNEPNVRIHLAAALFALIAGLRLHLSLSEWRWLIFAIALVLAAEALNTAVEQACNAVTRSYNPAIKAAKDVAAGAVLISAVAAALIGATIFLPHVIPSLAYRNLPSSNWICGNPGDA